MNVLLLYLLAMLIIINVGETHRILALLTIPVYSHFMFLEYLILELVEKGHEVDVVSHWPRKEKITRYNDISIAGSLPIPNNSLSISTIQREMGDYSRTIDTLVQAFGIDMCKAVFSTPALRTLLNTSVKYDLVITEIFASDCMLGFGHRFKAPVISFTSSVMLPWGNDRIGNPDNPSYISNYFEPFTKATSFKKRFINTLKTLWAKFKLAMVVEENNAVARNFFDENLPDLRDLAKNTSLIFTNSHFSITGTRPMVQNFIEVGGLHISTAKALPTGLEEYLKLTPPYKGVIYLSMGSMAAFETVEKEKLQALFDAFKEIPYKMLWKGDKNSLKKDLEIPDNIRFETWLPQLDILCHPSVKLFVTHGGLLGSQEAIHCGVPILGIPLFADQEANLLTFQDMGIAIVVTYADISKETVLDATKALLEEPTYKERTEKVSRLFKDRPISALNTAIYWVEYVIRHKGASHLRCAGADLAWYQLYSLDILLFLFITFSLALVCIYYLTVLLFGMWSVSRFRKFKTN